MNPEFGFETLKARYIITVPIPNGNQWYLIHDTMDPDLPNRVVATFWNGLVDAKELVGLVCVGLNGF